MKIHPGSALFGAALLALVLMAVSAQRSVTPLGSFHGPPVEVEVEVTNLRPERIRIDYDFNHPAGFSVPIFKVPQGKVLFLEGYSGLFATGTDVLLSRDAIPTQPISVWYVFLNASGGDGGLRRLLRRFRRSASPRPPLPSGGVRHQSARRRDRPSLLANRAERESQFLGRSAEDR